MNQRYNISNVRLSGYKSIKDVNISFKDGLNIVIGKNGVGKTNFLQFLFKTFHFDFDSLYNFSSELEFKAEDSTIKIENIRETKGYDLSSELPKTNLKVSIDNEISNLEIDEIKNTLFNKGLSASLNLVHHGIPAEYPIISSAFKTNFTDGFSSDLASAMRNIHNPDFLSTISVLLHFIVTRCKDLNFSDNLSIVFNGNLKDLKVILQKYSPINDIRLNENFNIYGEDYLNCSINNLCIEFNINGTWLPFEQLSDGTKRIFYIISETYISEQKPFFSNFLKHNQKTNKRIILIEEPELGIHPHQLMQLMEFLKVEAQTKQIIITTHSPLVLDILNDNELDRVIIASCNSQKEGTELNHLTEEEKTKAKSYMEEFYLSDYWKHSDLEK